MDISGRGDFSLSNTGTISGASNGLALFAGGSVSTDSGTLTNLGTLTTTGTGILIDGNTLINSGSVGAGVTMSGGAYLGNLTGGVITNAPTAIVGLGGANTVTDAGTIGGGISFAGTAGNLLVLEQGYKLTGKVAASGSGSILELRGSAGAPVTVNFNGLSLTNFGTVRFGPGSYETLAPRPRRTARLLSRTGPSARHHRRGRPLVHRQDAAQRNPSRPHCADVSALADDPCLAPSARCRAVDILQPPDARLLLLLCAGNGGPPLSPDDGSGRALPGPDDAALPPGPLEDIVDDQESAVRRMLDFIGEPFDGSARTARGIRPTDCFARDRTEAGMR